MPVPLKQGSAVRHTWCGPLPLAGRPERAWGPLIGTVEDRWRARFGHDEIAQLRLDLWGIVGRLDVELPDYLPVGEPRLVPRQAPDAAGPMPDLTLPALISKLLLSLAIDFERESDLSLGVYTSRGSQARR